MWIKWKGKAFPLPSHWNWKLERNFYSKTNQMHQWLRFILFWKNKIPTLSHLLFYFTSYVLNMFRILMYPSSGACDCAVELPHRRIVLVSMCVGVSVWLGWGGISVAGWSPQHGHNSNPTTPKLQHTKNRKQNDDVVIQQNSRKLLMMDILMSETCWAHKMWNQIASDIKLVFYSSIITVMHGPVYIRLFYFILEWHSTCCRRSFRPSSAVQDSTYSNRHLSNRYCCLLASGYEMELVT